MTAFRATALRWQAQRGMPEALMDRFAQWSASARARCSNVSTAPGQAPVSDVARKAFQHWRHEETGHWQPPKYSLRRQAQLVRASFQTGGEDQVRLSPKFERYARRINDMPRHEVITGWPTHIAWPTLSAEEDEKEAKRIAQTYGSHGPYAGRSGARMFKGHKGERASLARRRRVHENMSTMEATIAEWRREKAAERAKLKPISPL